MGIFDFLSGNKRLMSYEINMNAENDIYINVKKEIVGISSHEYLRLWAHYQCKIMYNFGYPDNETTKLNMQILSRIISKNFDVGVNCFQRAGMSDIMTYSRQPISKMLSFTGEYFSKESSVRFIKTDFPYNITEQQVLYSSIGLLQFALDQCLKSQNDLDVAWKLIFFMLVVLNNPEKLRSISALTVSVPEMAYREALKVDIKEILDEISKPSEDDISERFFKAYQEISSRELLSETAISYLKKKYPLDPMSTYNSFLGGFFIIGYNIRMTEESFADDMQYNIDKIKPNIETYNLLLSDMSKEDKISSIAEYKENNNMTCDLGPEVEDYSVLGLNLVNQYFSYILIDYSTSVGFSEKLNLPPNMATEISGRNAALGYCYRLAEEIVNS